MRAASTLLQRLRLNECRRFNPQKSLLPSLYPSLKRRYSTLDIPIIDPLEQKWLELDQALQTNTIHQQRLSPTNDIKTIRQRTLTLLEKRTWEAVDIDRMEDTCRWWAAQYTDEGQNQSFALFDTTLEQINWNPDLVPKDFKHEKYMGHLLNACLNSWMVCYTQGNGGIHPYQMLERVNDYYGAKHNVGRSARTYSLLMTAVLRRSDGVDSPPEFCESMLELMLQNQSTSRLAKPNAISFASCMKAWRQSNHPKAAELVESLYLNHVDLYNQEVVDDPPNTVVYQELVLALCNTNSADNVGKAYSYLIDWKNKPDNLPDAEVYRTVMFAWLRLSNIDKAVALLQEMLDLYHKDNASIAIDVSFFSKLIETLVKSDASVNHRSALEVYDLLARLYKDTNDCRFLPDTNVKKAMIILFAKLDKPSEAEQILVQLENEARVEGSRPSTLLPSHYSNVFESYARCNSPRGAERGEQLLLTGLKLAVALNRPILASGFTVNAAIKMWETSGHPDAATRADALLRKLRSIGDKYGSKRVVIQQYTCLRVMELWAKSRHIQAGDRAQAVLEYMEMRYKQGDESMKPYEFHYETARRAARVSQRCSAPSEEQKFRSLKSLVDATKRNKQSKEQYLSVMEGWRECDRSDSADNAQDLLDEMRERAARGELDMRPTHDHYAAAAAAWAQMPERPETALRVQKLLFDSVSDLKAGYADARPTKLFYKQMLKIFASEGDCTRAEQLLDHQLEEVKRGFVLASPDAETYNLVLLAMSSNTNEDDKAVERADALLNRMRANGISPDDKTWQLMGHVKGNFSFYPQSIPYQRDDLPVEGS
jgi:tetratricopeptide (TPR) repeat protein